jgi:hypothetical protein
MKQDITAENTDDFRTKLREAIVRATSFGSALTGLPLKLIELAHAAYVRFTAPKLSRADKLRAAMKTIEDDPELLAAPHFFIRKDIDGEMMTVRIPVPPDIMPHVPAKLGETVDGDRGRMLLDLIRDRIMVGEILNGILRP